MRDNRYVVKRHMLMLECYRRALRAAFNSSSMEEARCVVLIAYMWDLSNRVVVKL